MRQATAIVILCASSIGRPSFAASERCSATTSVASLCAIVGDAAKYDGKEVTLRGTYRITIHGSVLMSPDCEATFVNMRWASDYNEDKSASKVVRSLTRKNRFQPVTVVLRGNFRLAREGQCFGQDCLRYEVEGRELLCAENSNEPVR